MVNAFLHPIQTYAELGSIEGNVHFEPPRPDVDIDDAQMPPMMAVVMRADRRR